MVMAILSGLRLDLLNAVAPQFPRFSRRPVVVSPIVACDLVANVATNAGIPVHHDSMLHCDVTFPNASVRVVRPRSDQPLCLGFSYDWNPLPLSRGYRHDRRDAPNRRQSQSWSVRSRQSRRSGASIDRVYVRILIPLRYIPHSRRSSRNAAGERIVVSRNDPRSVRWLSPEIKWVALPSTAHSRNISSSGSASTTSISIPG